jgi:hypothetical protein
MIASGSRKWDDNFPDMKKFKFCERGRASTNNRDIRSCKDMLLVCLVEPVEDLSMVDFLKISTHMRIEFSKYDYPFNIEIFSVSDDFLKNSARSLTATEHEDVFFVRVPMNLCFVFRDNLLRSSGDSCLRRNDGG